MRVLGRFMNCAPLPSLLNLQNPLNLLNLFSQSKSSFFCEGAFQALFQNYFSTTSLPNHFSEIFLASPLATTLAMPSFKRSTRA